MSRKRLTLLFFMLAMMAMLALPARAAEGIQITLTPDRDELSVGDPVQLTLEVNHPAGYQVIIPQLEQMWGDLEVRSQSQATTTPNQDGTETTRQTIEVTLFDLGDFETAELSLTISDGAGGLFEEMVPSASLTVIPTLPEDDAELRDIKPQAAMVVPVAWPWIVGGLVLAVVAAVAGWWAYRRWQGKPFGLAPFVDNRPPWQVAYDELARIEGLGLLERRHFKEYYTLVTDAMRTYLENQFHLRVFDRTTYELKAIFRQSDLDPDHARQFLALFSESDLVKFAKFTPDLESAQQLVADARQLVDLTRPKSESELEEFLTPDQTATAPVATSKLGYESGR